MPQISVIVPVYNVEPYLRRCVDSILGQTFRDFELILVDDGSPDGCPAICDEYAAQDDRVQVIHQKNGGLSAARNAGIDWVFAHSDSQWIAFIDSDDCVHSNYFEVLYNNAQTYAVDISICGEVPFYENESVPQKVFFEGQKLHTAQNACKLIYNGLAGHASFVSACGKLYKKKLFEDIRYPYGRLHEDQFTTYRLLYKVKQIVEDGRCLYGYYINVKGITHGKFNLKRYDDVEACNEAISFFMQHGERRVAEEAEHRRDILLAKYAMMARKSGLSTQLPKQYQMSVCSAYKRLIRLQGVDSADYFVYRYYPRYVKMNAYLRKISGMIHKEASGEKEAD